jgi:hypothetical protein
MIARAVGWIAFALCALIVSASLDNIPDPPSTAARSGLAHQVRTAAGHRANLPAPVIIAALCMARLCGSTQSEPAPAVFPPARVVAATVHSAADSSPPLLFL